MDRKKILIVDDIPANARLITHMLEDVENYDLLVAMDGESCLDIVRLTEIDLILLDIMMPGMNGYEVCKILQEDETFQKIPVIFVSAKNEIKDKVAGLEYGGVDYLTKPVDMAELKARISTHLKLSDLQKSLRASSKSNIKLKNQYKSLIHVMSHDLGNYLMAINGFANLALSRVDGLESKDSITEKYLEKIYTSSENVCHFLDKIKELQAISEDKMDVYLETINLYDLVESSISVFTDRFDKKDIKVDLSGLDSSLVVMADYQWLHLSVLNNVLSNALKFSDPSSKIEVFSVEEEKWTHLVIRDHGVGIEESRLQKIFQTDMKTSTIGTEGERGTGFGMPLIRLWMEKFHGRVEVSSTTRTDGSEDYGTQVSLVFPIYIADSFHEIRN